MNTHKGWGPNRPTFPLATHEDYEASCKACEVVVTLSRKQWAAVRTRLEYNRKAQGPKGRALKEDMPSLGLRRNDRLEPDSFFQDVADFDTVTVWPVRASFWRRTEETRVKHRNYLFRPDLGISIDSICIDTLHTLYLGPVLDWVAKVMWSIVRVNAHNVPGTGIAQTLPLIAMRLRNDLQEFYRDWKRRNPGEDITELEELTPGMFGNATNEKFGPLKAAEVKHMIPFCLHALGRHAEKIGTTFSAHLVAIGEAFTVLIAVMRESPVILPQTQRQRMFDAVARICHFWDLAGIHAKPKRHLLLHLVERSASQGNPAHYACWMDETLNKTLARVGAAAHRAVWELRILREMEIVRETAAKKPHF